MSGILAGINAIPGVIGSIIFDSSDQCLEHELPPPYEPVLIAGVLAEVHNAASMLGALDGSPWQAFAFRFESGYLLVRCIDDVTLLVLAEPSINLAMLNVGFTVATLKIVQRAAPAAAAATSAASSQSGRVAASKQPRLSVSASGQQRLSPSPQVFSDSGGVASADAVPRAQMDSLLQALARHVGPMAKIMIKEDLAKMGAAVSTLGLSQYDDFIRLLAMRVTEGSERKEFLAEVEKLTR